MQCFSGADLSRCESRSRRVRCRSRHGAKGPAPKRRVSCILSLNGGGTEASTQIPFSEGWQPGWVLVPYLPTPEPDGPRPSREGNRLTIFSSVVLGPKDRWHLSRNKRAACHRVTPWFRQPWLGSFSQTNPRGNSDVSLWNCLSRFDPQA